MNPYLLRRQESRAADPCLCLAFWNDNKVLLALVSAIVFVAVILTSTSRAENEYTSQEECCDGFPKPASRNTVKMTEEEYQEFLQQRTRFCDIVWFRDPNIITGKTQLQLREMQKQAQNADYCSMVFVDLPGRLVAFSSERPKIDFDKTDKASLVRFTEAIRYYPEIRWLFLENVHEREELLSLLLRETQHLPFLYAIQVQTASLSRDTVGTMAENASAQRLEFVDCRISLEAAAELARMKSLRELVVTDGTTVTPEWFVTLAKLPKFRDLFLNDPDAFDVLIDEQTRTAIESLDGRLESFCTDEMMTTVHPSIVRALLNVKSLRKLDIAYVGPGLTSRDIEKLKELHGLTRLDMHFGWSRSKMTEEEFIKARNLVGILGKAANERAEKERRERASK